MAINLKKSIIVMLAAIIFLLTLPVEAAGKRGQAKQFVVAQSKYASSIRWSEFELAWGYVDPAYREEHPLTDLESERLKQIQVTGYEEKTQELLTDGSVEMRVVIRLINRNTQAERSILDTQIWRWDVKAKRWWLTTGLPDFSAKSF